jgi:hypothetical protein
MSGYEQQADMDAASGADEAAREQHAWHPYSITARTSGPKDFRELLAALAPLGWEAARRAPGVYLPEGKGGLSWIRSDGPGWAWGYGAIGFERMRLETVPEYIKRRMGR